MTNFKAKSIRCKLIQRFQAKPDRVFPLLCPVREYEWIEPWNCEILHSDSGIAEQNCIFRTRFHGESSDDVWVISHYEPNTRIDFVRVNALRTMCISITLSDNGDGTTCAVNELILVGLTEQGNEALGEIAANFSLEFRMGEAMLNSYLTTGKMLPWQDAVEIASEQR